MEVLPQETKNKPHRMNPRLQCWVVGGGTKGCRRLGMSWWVWWVEDVIHVIEHQWNHKSDGCKDPLGLEKCFAPKCRVSAPTLYQYHHPALLYDMRMKRPLTSFDPFSICIFHHSIHSRYHCIHFRVGNFLVV